jgi:single-strand DNA-binding protein
MVNKVILIGRLGGDPTVRQAGGSNVANFSIATSEKWTDKTGEKKERTEWHRVVVWGKSADLAGQYLAKGNLVYVEGKLRTRQWEDKEGHKQFTTEVQADSFRFMEKRQGGESSHQARGDDAGQYTEDNIPF